MSRNFDFNAVTQTTMNITLPDAQRTRLTLTAPKVSLVERLSANAAQMLAVFQSKDASAIREIYALIAKLLSCNKEHHTVTAEAALDCLTTDHVTAFVVAYMDFLTEIKQAKN